MIKTNRPIPAGKIKLLIFDLDGTLVDSRMDLTNSINTMLRNYHRAELAPEVIASYIGDGAPTLVRRSLGFNDDHPLTPKDEEFIEDSLVFFLEYYREHKLDNTHVYDGVIETLHALRASLGGTANGTGCTMSVLSNKPVGPSRAIVNALGLRDFFVNVYGGNSFETKKPDPFGALTLLAESNASPDEAVIIGDSDVDILTARNSGIWSCGVTYGLAPASLMATPPDVLVDSPREWAEVFR